MTGPESLVSSADTYHPDTHLLDTISKPELRPDHNNGQPVMATFNYVDALGHTETLNYDLYRRRTRIVVAAFGNYSYDDNGAMIELRLMPFTRARIFPESHIQIRDQIIEGSQHRDHHPAQQNPQHDGHGWLDQGLQARDGFPDIPIIEIAHILERRIQCAGVFSYSQHAQHQRREESGVFESGADAGPLGDFAGRASGRCLHGFISHQIPADPNAIEHGDAGGI
uniref:YD repeat-containing protein n=1 Tax=Candidatus Kentrum sp. SD TaxID=2126332 RepID=A0A450YC39_9GAMM|nr:MAG: YD repeat-containing protein [Candidatus Kentron sp. SD]VFK43950.1 MAG: YD repeat-containing protein [Candidatus Kentron sp. SD]